MATFTVALMIFAASLASWLLSQALLHRKPQVPGALVLGTAAASCLLAAAGFGIVVAPFWMRAVPAEVALAAPVILPVRAVAVAATPAETNEAVSVPARSPTIKVSKPVAEALKQAQDAVRRKDWQAALKHIEAAASIPDRSPSEKRETARFAGYVHYQLGDEVAAAAALSEQLRWTETASADYWPLLKVAAQLNFKIKLYPRSIERAQEYLRRNPDDLDMRVLIAQAYYLSGAYQQARREIDTAIDARPRQDVPESWLMLKLASIQRDGDPLAVERLRQELLQNYPQHERALGRTTRQRDIVVSAEGAMLVSAPLNPLRADTGALLTEWPATDCVKSSPSEAGLPRTISNRCGRAVGVLFASCERSHVECASARQAAWQYEDRMLLTAITGSSSAAAVAEESLSDTSLVAVSGRIRYLACFVAVEAEELNRLRGEPAQRARERLDELWKTDDCLARVSRWIEAGRKTGQSPDMLLAQARDVSPTSL